MNNDIPIVKKKKTQRPGDLPASTNQNQHTQEQHFQEQYISQLNPKEMKAYHIAQSHLESSFSLEKSIGFKEFETKTA